MWTGATHLDIAQHVVLDRGEGDGAEDIWQEGRGTRSVKQVRYRFRAPALGVPTEHGGQSLGGLEEVGGGDGIVLGGVDGDVNERLLEGVEVSASGGDHCYCCHDENYCRSDSIAGLGNRNESMKSERGGTGQFKKEGSVFKRRSTRLEEVG